MSREPANRRSRTHSVSPCRTTKSLSLPTTPPFYLDSPNRRVGRHTARPGCHPGPQARIGATKLSVSRAFPRRGDSGTVKDSIDDDLERSDFVTRSRFTSDV